MPFFDCGWWTESGGVLREPNPAILTLGPSQVEKDTIWTFEQTQGLDFFCLYTPVRMTVIKLKSGGLWVHSPVAPTAECLRLIKELNAPVEYIVLPTFAYEHKVFVGPFSRKFPKAKVGWAEAAASSVGTIVVCWYSRVHCTPQSKQMQKVCTGIHKSAY